MSARIAKSFGLRGGKRRRRQDPIARSLLTVIAAIAVVKVGLLAVLHMAAVKGVSR
jgi:hypothetical protein